MIAELVAQGKIKHALTANGKTLAESCKGKFSDNRKLILPFAMPMQKKAGFLNIKGNLFDSAIMKTSVIMPEFRKRFLENPQDPMVFEGAAIVFDGPEDHAWRLNVAALLRKAASLPADDAEFRLPDRRQPGATTATAAARHGARPAFFAIA